MFKRVLVPLDGSMLAESALEPALHLAEQTAGTVFLIRVPVFMESGIQSNPEFDRVWSTDNTVPEYEDTTAYLRETRNRIARPGVTVRTVIGEGERANAIINTAADRNADLIVMASHARRGVPRWLLGSVASKVIGRAPIPVMLVRKTQQYRHILVILDGSAIAEHILEPALALAAGFDSRITFLQVDELGEVGEKSSWENYLDQILERYSASGVHVTGAIGKGPAANTIMTYAGKHDVDLVAMSTKSRTGLKKLIFGSVTEKVMCENGSAMLIVPQAGDTPS